MQIFRQVIPRGGMGMTEQTFASDTNAAAYGNGLAYPVGCVTYMSVYEI